MNDFEVVSALEVELYSHSGPQAKARARLSRLCRALADVSANAEELLARLKVQKTTLQRAAASSDQKRKLDQTDIEASENNDANAATSPAAPTSADDSDPASAAQSAPAPAPAGRHPQMGT